MSSDAPLSTMKLISLQDFNLDGSKKLKVGEVFEMSWASAQFLIATKRARAADDQPERDKPKPHTRKDVRAED